MKSQFGKRLLCAGLISCLALGILTGCGEEETVDYSIEGIEEITENGEISEDGEIDEVAASGLSQFEEGEVWKETLTIKMIDSEWDGETVTETDVNVNAKITVPQVEQMSVIEVTEPEFDAEYKEAVAEKFFAEGEIYYGDLPHLPKKEQQELKDYFMGGGEISISYVDDYMESLEWDQYWQDLGEMLNNTEELSDTYTPVEEYTINRYTGIYEGRMYNLSFIEATGDIFSSYRQAKRIKWTVEDLYQVCPEKFKEQEDLTCSPWMRGSWIDNQCEISEEEALKQAKKFAEQLGLDYPVYSYSRPLMWGTAPERVTEESESDDWGINGYVFYFDLGVDEISFVSYGVEEEYWGFGWSESEEMQYSLQAQLQIYVTDQGVIRVIADNPMEITGVLEGVELLPLDTVKSIMKEAMNEQSEILLLDDNRTNFNSMELIYFRVRDKENTGNYSYVPTWRLGYVTKDTVLHETSVRNPVLINAIDGSLIDFHDET